MEDPETIESTTRAGMDRREFALRSLMAMLSGVTITVSGCGGGGGGGPAAPSTPNPNPTPPTAPGDKAGTIAANHGHTAVISSAQLSAGGALTLGIRGQADHPHTVELSAADVVSIRDGRQVAKESSNDDFHNHTVTFN